MDAGFRQLLLEILYGLSAFMLHKYTVHQTYLLASPGILVGAYGLWVGEVGVLFAVL